MDDRDGWWERIREFFAISVTWWWWFIQFFSLSLVKFYSLTHFPTKSCILFFAKLLHSLIIWITVSSLTPHNLHFLFCFDLSIFALTKFILMVPFYSAINIDSFPPLRFSLRSHVQVISWAISLVCRLKYPYSCFASTFCFQDFLFFLFFFCP